MAVVLVSGDLMGASRIEGAARLAGAQFRMVGNVEDAVEICAMQSLKLVLIDLTTAGLDVAALVERIRSRSKSAPAIIAYGPHVHEKLLEAAKAAGCDRVLSRGQFMAQADTIIALSAAAATKAAD
jgi:DNA-binding NtrC family response regulator